MCLQHHHSYTELLKRERMPSVNSHIRLDIFSTWFYKQISRHWPVWHRTPNTNLEFFSLRTRGERRCVTAVLTWQLQHILI